MQLIETIIREDNGKVSIPQAVRGCMQRKSTKWQKSLQKVSIPQAVRGCMQREFSMKRIVVVIVSIPQAVRGCMQLCVPEPLWDKPSKWGFGQETSFSIVFAISEHGHRFVFRKKHRLPSCPTRGLDVHAQIGQVFVSRRSFLAFAHNLPTYIFYPNLTGFSIPFIKKLPRSFRFAAVLKTPVPKMLA